jgi:hypothetical protein
LFPIAVPLLYWVAFRGIKLRVSVFHSLLLAFVPIIIYIILLLIPESNQSLSIYFFKRLLVRVDSMPTSAYRLEIIWRLFTELIPVFIGVIFIFIILRKKGDKLFSNNKLLAIFFGLIGLAASAPLMLTMVQKGWYLVPSFPYFAIASGLLISPLLANLVEKLYSKTIIFRGMFALSIVFLMAVIIITWTFRGKVSRENETIVDVYAIGKVVPEKSVLTVPSSLYDEYDFILQGFLVSTSIFLLILSQITTITLP